MYEDLDLVPAANVDADTVSETLDGLTFEFVRDLPNAKHDEKLNKTKGN